MSEDRDLEAVAAALTAAWNRHDMAAFAALFAEDAHFVNVVGTWWKGRAEIEAAHAQAHATFFRDSRLESRVASITSLKPDVAALHIAWDMTGHTGPDGSPGAPRSGLMLLVLSKQAGAGWQIRIAQNTDTLPGLRMPPTKN